MEAYNMDSEGNVDWLGIDEAPNFLGAEEPVEEEYFDEAFD